MKRRMTVGFRSPLRRARVWGVVLALVAALPAGAGQEVTVAGVVHVKNGPSPSEGRQTLELEKLWSAGGEDDDVLFGLISQVRTDEEGNLYLLDTQLSEVKVFSPSGRLVKTLSREGEGPGEVRLPIDLLFMPGGSLGLVQSFPGKIVQVDREGHPAGTFTIGGADAAQGGFVLMLDALARGEDLVIAGMQIQMKPDGTGQTRTRILASYGMDGREKVRYASSSTEIDLQNFRVVERDDYFVFPRRWAIDAQGRIYAPIERDRYAITVYNPDGSVARVIEREFSPPKRSPIELARVQSVIDAQRRQVPIEFHVDLAETEPAIARIQVREGGEIWVAHSGSHRDQPEGVLMTYDVFDPSGHFVRQVSIACQGNRDNDGLFFLGPDRVLLVKGLADAAMALQGAGSSAAGEEEAEPMEIVCYRIRG